MTHSINENPITAITQGPLLGLITRQKKYKEAKKILDGVISRKEKENSGKPKKTKDYYAYHVAKTIKGIDHKKLAAMESVSSPLSDGDYLLIDKICEEIKKDILPKAGAGQWGTDELKKQYIKDTPGQNVLSYKQYNEAACGLISYSDLKRLENFADGLLNKFGVDIEFTKHFGERMSDDRNRPCIDIDELKEFFKKVSKEKAEKIKSLKGKEAVLVDMQTRLNLPVVIKYVNGGFDVVMKTIMRKNNFLTKDKKVYY